MSRKDSCRIFKIDSYPEMTLPLFGSGKRKKGSRNLSNGVSNSEENKTINLVDVIRGPPQ